MLDECETASPCRQKLAGAASVMIQTQKRTHFIEWAEGLETSEGLDWEKRRVVLVLATNLPSELDPAVLEKKSSVLCPLPDEVTITEWWARHAKHLWGRNVRGNIT